MPRVCHFDPYALVSSLVCFSQWCLYTRPKSYDVTALLGHGLRQVYRHLFPQKNRLTAKSGSVDGPSERSSRTEPLIMEKDHLKQMVTFSIFGLGPTVLKMCHRELGGGEDFVVLAF